MKLRKTISLTALLSFILLLITSVVLYLTPQGKIAFWANWKMMGLGKEQWGALHTNLGILFVIAGIIHTVLNWKPIVTYLKNKAQEMKVFTADFNTALIITLAITLLTLFELPPLRAVQDLNHELKENAAEKYGEPPYGHAEASSLDSFCKRIGLDLETSLKKLEQANIKPACAEATLSEIAQAYNITPQAIYDHIKPAPPAAGDIVIPKRPGSGFGRKTLAAVCAEYGLDLQETVDGLKKQGIEAGGDDAVKTIAEKNDMEPFRVFEALKNL